MPLHHQFRYNSDSSLQPIKNQYLLILKLLAVTNHFVINFHHKNQKVISSFIWFSRCVLEMFTKNECNLVQICIYNQKIVGPKGFDPLAHRL